MKYKLSTKNNLWGLIDSNNKITIPYKYIKIDLHYYNEVGLIPVVNEDGLYGVINIKNEIIIPFKYKSIYLGYLKRTELIRVENEDDLCGIINIKDELLIDYQYINIHMHLFNKIGLLLVQNKNKLWDVINIKNEVIVYNKKDLYIYEDEYIKSHYIIIDSSNITNHFVINKQHKILLYDKNIYIQNKNLLNN